MFSPSAGCVIKLSNVLHQSRNDLGPLDQIDCFGSVANLNSVSFVAPHRPLKTTLFFSHLVEATAEFAIIKSKKREIGTDKTHDWISSLHNWFFPLFFQLVADGKSEVMNPCWRQFTRCCGSCLVASFNNPFRNFQNDSLLTTFDLYLTVSHGGTRQRIDLKRLTAFILPSIH